MMELEVNKFLFMDHLDEDGEMEILSLSPDDGVIYLSEAQAKQIVSHLSKVFDLRLRLAKRVLGTIPKGEPMPQTVQAFRHLAQRDLELIEEQREEIAKLKCKVNNLTQKLKIGRASCRERV